MVNKWAPQPMTSRTFFDTYSSPERRTRALEVVHKEWWLQLSDRIRLRGPFGKGQMADEYMAWAREGSPERKTWVCMALGVLPSVVNNQFLVSAAALLTCTEFRPIPPSVLNDQHEVSAAVSLTHAEH
ncbi:hypothetical protein B0H14DRAFT_3893125 [Mycena olivaceomarginata]|nr:hypothetical protein B0H14DRAFT_3893125 [Mycena olivaceomarginata]